MITVNKINVNGQAINIGGSGTSVPENITANDVTYDSSTQYDENTVGEKITNLVDKTQYINIFTNKETQDEILFSSDNDEEIYVKIDNNGLYSKNYYDIEGNIILSSNKKCFKSFNDSKTLSTNEVLSLKSIHIVKNILLNVEINNNFTNIDFGVGYYNNETYYYRGYNARWITLTSDTVVIKSAYNGAPNIVNTYQHDITLTNKTNIIIKTNITKDNNSTILQIYNDLGDVFVKEFGEFGVGTPFIINNSSDDINVKMSFFPLDIEKSIWCFGDSYFSFSSAARWPYYIRDIDCINWLSNNQPGLSPSGAVVDLKNLLSLNIIPKYVFWCLGMNGTTQESKKDNEYVINDYQKTNIDAVISLAKQYGFELILSTIPTVPARQKTGFNKYIKSLNYRYVDFSKAVGTNEFGQWNNNLLSSDEVHPSESGAKVLYSQVIIDFPEITIK